MSSSIGRAPASKAGSWGFESFLTCIIMNKMLNYFKSIGVELRKVSWLTKEQLLNSTIIVGVFSIIITTIIFIMDFGLTQVIKVIFNIEIG